MSNHLAGGKVNVALLQERIRSELLKLVDKCDKSKAIVWDESLADLVILVMKPSDLREHDVTVMRPLRSGQLPSINVKNIIFITRPLLHLMDMVADNVHGEERRGIRKEFHLFFVPRKSLLCEKKLKNRGVFGNFTLIEELSCDIFPFDNDLMSMELDMAFKEYYLENDPTCLYQAAQAIMTLQDLYGIIPRITGKGQAARQVWDLVGRLMLEPRTTNHTLPTVSQIDQLFIIDRAVDLLSPVATQLTYEGLIDELFQINNTLVYLPQDKFAQPDDESHDIVSVKKQIILNSADEVFAEIRDKNFNAVGLSLSKKAKLISSQLEGQLRDKSVQEIKQFTARLPHMMATKKALATYTAIAELIKEVTDSADFLNALQTEQELMLCVDTGNVHPYIEDCIANKHPLIKVLRLICLQSVTNSGLKPKVLEHYKREIVQTYGFQHLLTLINLEKAGLLKTHQGTRSYVVLRKTLRLTVEDGSEVAPTDINYVHSVYAPLSVRLAQNAARPVTWRSLADVLSLLPGPTLDETQTLPPGQTYRRASISSQSSVNDSPKVILVFFLGGCTYAEVSALRFLSQQQDANVEYVIATTKLINGNSFIKSLMENLSPDPMDR